MSSAPLAPLSPRRSRLPGLARLGAGLVAGGAAAGLGLTAYAAWEAQAFVLRHVEVPLLPPGMAPLTVLHLSDIHMTPTQRGKQDWLRSLWDTEPDLVINTGDNLSHRDAVPTVASCLGPLLERPGVFVLGSNDYFSPVLRNPLRYLLPDDGQRSIHSPQLPWPELTRGFTEAGWVDLTNTRARVQAGEASIAFAGVDDPHLDYDRLDLVAGPADAEADVRLGVTHAPYLRVLDQYAADGYDAIIAGHTHGGQVCLPGGRALTTNCDLEPARARGLHRHPADSSDGDPASSWLHVSAGVGTSPYVQLRVACRPEATLMRLVPPA